MERVKTDIEILLREGKSVEIPPTGWSMYPLIVPGRDSAVIEPINGRRLGRGDVVLYRRDESILVLHRIVKVREEGFYMVGDNQKEVEGPLRFDQARGIMTEVHRNGKVIKTKGFLYRIVTGFWLFLRPVRPFISKTGAAIKRFFKRFTH